MFSYGFCKGGIGLIRNIFVALCLSVCLSVCLSLCLSLSLWEQAHPLRKRFFSLRLKKLVNIFFCLKSSSVPCLKRPLKNMSKIGFQDRLLLNAGQKYCRMSQESILQYFRPSLSYHLSLRPLICLVLSGRLRQVLLYISFMYMLRHSSFVHAHLF